MSVFVLAGCRPSAEKRDEEQWRAAEAQWQRREMTAYEAWQRLDPRQPHGREAWARLARADAGYRRAIELIRTDQPGLRETFAGALATAPIDPRLYLPLARACRDRGWQVRAADFYQKYLAHQPPLPEASTARAELAALMGDLPPDSPQPPPRTRQPWRIAGIAVAALLLVLLGATVWRRRRARPLRELLRERPEVHQTVAYQIGCLRHEFLKHRIGAAGEALDALVRGQASPEQTRFLEERLCRGEPLLAAWRAHVLALERSLGVRVVLTRADPLFRSAQRALVVLARAAARAGGADAHRVQQARDILARLDRELAVLVGQLACCPVDESFLADVLVATRAEWASGKVELDEITVGPVPAGVAVDVYRTDLRIVLKNILRNAIAALAASPHPRRLAMDVLLDLEPTGEEVVRIRVQDSSSQRLDESAVAAEPTSVEHGLDIVRTALLRYDGSLEIAPGAERYTKAVVVRLFRSQATHPELVGEAA
jgi:signal transduction histidine kinase